MTDPRPATLAGVLEQLDVPRQRLLYVQSSVDWIQRAGFGAAEVIPTLLDWAGSAGTLVMPTYPFHSTHLDYLESRVPFDVLRTPATIGLLPEMFRRTKGVVRSLDPDFCVSAIGSDADAVVGTEPAEPDPFGQDSSYQRMIDREAVLVGLGVSLNTNSFIHLIDSQAAAGYPAPVYGDALFSMTVVDAGGGTREVSRKALRPEFQRLTSPSAIEAVMMPAAQVFGGFEIDGTRFFKWELAPWASWCLDHARRKAGTGEWPCWLSRVGGHVQ